MRPPSCCSQHRRFGNLKLVVQVQTSLQRSSELSTLKPKRHEMARLAARGDSGGAARRRGVGDVAGDFDDSVHHEVRFRLHDPVIAVFGDDVLALRQPSCNGGVPLKAARRRSVRREHDYRRIREDTMGIDLRSAGRQIFELARDGQGEFTVYPKNRNHGFLFFGKRPEPRTGDETEPVSTEVPRLMRRMSTLAYFLVPEVMSAAMERIRPMREKNGGAAANLCANRDEPAVMVRRRVRFGGNHGIDENDAGDLFRKTRGEERHGETSERMADEDVGRANIGALEQSVKLCDDLVGGARHWAGIAPTKTGLIVTDDAERTREFALKIRPAKDRGHEAGFKHDGRAAIDVAGFQDVQAMRAEIDEAAGRWVKFAVAARG